MVTANAELAASSASTAATAAPAAVRYERARINSLPLSESLGGRGEEARRAPSPRSSDRASAPTYSENTTRRSWLSQSWYLPWEPVPTGHIMNSATYCLPLYMYVIGGPSTRSPCGFWNFHSSWPVFASYAWSTPPTVPPELRIAV